MRRAAILLILCCFALVSFPESSRAIDLKKGIGDQFRKLFHREQKRPITTSQPQVITSPVLSLSSNPPGATVYVDGTDRGVTPVILNLEQGQHELRFVLKGYIAIADTITIKNGEKLVRSAVLVPEKKVSSRPAVAADKSQGWILWVTLIVVGVAAVLFFARIRSRSALQSAEAAPVIFNSMVATPARPPEETPTYAYTNAESEPLTPGATPPDIEEMKKHAQPLKDERDREFGAYELQAVLGRGGMGTTYMAIRKRDNLPVAIKIPHEHLQDNPEFSQRFLREGSLGSTLHHPNIIRIYEADQWNQRPYIVMELIDGGTLEQRLKQRPVLPLHEALEIARDIALALDYARLKGVVHRDLKPENIMLPKRGGVKVMDYGIARIVGSPGLTASDSYLGTPSYSAPESVSGDVDQQSDLYSLGIILYRMLSGTLPFNSVHAFEVLNMHRFTPLPAFPKELQIPETVQRLVKVLTAKNKPERYRDAESFLIELNRILKTL